FQQPEFEGYRPKSVSEDISNEVRETSNAPLVKELVLDDKLEKKIVSPPIAKIEFVRPKQQEKPVRKPVKYAEMYRERVESGNNYTRVNYNYSAKKTHPSAHRNMVPRAVLMKIGLKAVNIVRPVTTAHPKATVYSARPMSHFSKSAQSIIKRPNQTRTTLTNKNFSQKVNTARPNSAVVNVVRGHPQKEDQGYVDSRFSRHMTGNMSYLSDFKEFDRGYVTFGGGAKGGKITGKVTLKTGKLDFKDVYFVKDLQFNLFSVSHMCDKKNSVLFTNTGCFVISREFKLADESQVLLKVPRKNNMYSVDMKDIVPKECLTCLVANATLDESMLWHRRLGHVKFKTINKLAKENLVRGLPIKRFKNDQTCVACLKGKQHKASYVTTEFKNRVMSEFYKQKGIKREFSVARTPQQNGVAERRNKTLIEAARTMVLMVKPHNKIPYELFRGRTPALSFMRPFGCHVIILNTLDHLGKFDGKSDDGFLVGYSMNSKAFRVYNIRTRKVEEHLHVRFLEDKLTITGEGPKWLFDIDMLTKSMNYVPVVVGTNSNDFVDSSLFDSSSKNASNDETQPSSDAGKKEDGGVNMFSLGDNATLDFTDADFFDDETKMDMSNITTTYLVPSSLNTRIHKDHSLDGLHQDLRASYCLDQALRASYETLAKYLLDNGFHRGKIYQTLFIKKQKGIFCLYKSMLMTLSLALQKRYVPILRN
ncbi:ribonuclease H-like domain-containing protein, partial [Tanacetum coccineum]